MFKCKFINNICIFLVEIFILDRNKRRKLKNKIKEYPCLQELKKIKKEYKNYWIFCSFYPFGDMGLACSLIKNFKVQNGGKVLVLTREEQSFKILNLFPSIDKVQIISNSLYGYIDAHPTCKIEKGEYYFLNHWKFWQAPIYKSNNFFDVYKNMLGLPINTKPETLVFPDKLKNKVNKIYKQFSQNSKGVILLTPEANSFNEKEFDVSFWYNVAEKIEALGFKVIFNQKKKKTKFENIFLPLDESLYFATLCPWVIGVRSGFHDLLALCNAQNIISLYPNELYFKLLTKHVHLTEIYRLFCIDKNKSFKENMINISSLKMINPNCAKEFMFSNRTQLIHKILDTLNCG